MKKFKDYISGDELTLVDFYANWCGPCRAMHPIIEEYKKLMRDKVNVLKLDIDSPTNAVKVREYRISAVPTLIFFRNGEVLWRGSGMTSLAELKIISDRLLASQKAL
jgi:thioredoxin 1